MSKSGNRAFMLSVGVGAALGVGGVMAFGLTALSLAILILSVIGSVLVGLFLEGRIDRKEEEAEDRRREEAEQLQDSIHERVTREVKKQATKKTARVRGPRTVRYGSRSWTFDDADALIEFLILHELIMDAAEFHEMEDLELAATLSLYDGADPMPVVVDNTATESVVETIPIVSELPAPPAYDSSLPALDVAPTPEPEPVYDTSSSGGSSYDYSGGYDSGSDFGSSYDSGGGFDSGGFDGGFDD